MNQSIKASVTIGSNMRHLRKLKGFTQDALAAQLQLLGCDLSGGNYAKIEAGIRHISLEELKAVKTVFNTTYDELLK